MKITASKKELFRDNCKMRDELNQLFARNVELVILMEQQEERIAETNLKIKEINESIEYDKA